MGEGTTENSGDNSAADNEIERQLRALMDEVTAESRFREPSADERQKLAGKAQKQSAKTARKTQRGARKQQRKTWGRRRGHKALWSWTVAIIILACSLLVGVFRRFVAIHIGLVQPGHDRFLQLIELSGNRDAAAQRLQVG